MRLVSIELSGFRGFSKSYKFDVDADAVVVIGANGHGKTSLFDGVLWALSGRIPRFHNNDANLVSLYSETGQARVALRLKDPPTGKQVVVTRSFDGKERRVTVETEDGSFQGPSAEGKLIDLLWPDAASASDPGEALASVLTLSVYLQQDLVRHFIEAASEQERFAAVSELVGIGRVTELQSSLEQAKKAWSAITNQREAELRLLRNRQTMIEARLSEFKRTSSKAALPMASETWNQWWQGLSSLGLKVVQVEPASREAATAIDGAIKQLEGVRRSTERRLEVLTAMKTQIAELANRPVPAIAALRARLTNLRSQLDDLKRVSAAEQARLAELRRHQAELKEKNEQLKALAILALKHLTEHCPVCGQTYDKKATRVRLETIAKRGIGGEQVGQTSSDKLTEFLAAVAEKEKEIAAAEVALRSGEQEANETQIAQQTIYNRLSELGIAVITPDSRKAELDRAVGEVDALLGRVVELQRIGESLALQVAQSSAAAVIDELRREAETLHRETADLEKAVSARTQTGELAQRLIEALREAGSAVVEDRLREIGPLFQNIWARIDPHPAFRSVDFLCQVFRGKGQLFTVVRDLIEDKESQQPATILSSSQVNALAVSVFLAVNFGVPNPPLSVAILDDPLQSLDDVNLLGLVDLFRRTKDQRQLFVSTHDTHFGNLLSRKLRPTSGKGRTIIIELDSWSRQGPSVATHEMKSDPVPLRLVSSRAG